MPASRSPEQHLTELVERYPALREVQCQIADSFGLLRDSLKNGGTLFVCGNGGSAADAEHIVGELMKNFILSRPIPAERRRPLVAAGEDGRWLAERLCGGLRAISLNGHPSLATALANDSDARLVFAQPLLALGRPGDALLGISTSGNAANVRLAMVTARACGMKCIALTGRGGGALRPIADVTVGVPADGTPAVQELHVPVYHALCAMLEAAFFGDGAG